MTDELMNGSDTEFIGLRDIELTDNPDNSRVLTPEANVHVIDEWNTHSKGLEANKKMKIRKKKKCPSHGNETFLRIIEKIVFIRAEFPTNLMKVL